MPTHTPFPLFHSHLDLAKKYWQKLVLPGDLVIDATCGNGHDTLFLAQLALKEGCEKPGAIIAMDMQRSAIESTRQHLALHLPQALLASVLLLQQCHSAFPAEVSSASAKLIVYNLGYLPGGNKTLTTMCHSTLLSLQAAQQLICKGGMLSITCYPGHAEGKKEEDVVRQFAAMLDPRQWSCCYHQWVNRKAAPSLLLLQRNCLPD